MGIVLAFVYVLTPFVVSAQGTEILWIRDCGPGPVSGTWNCTSLKTICEEDDNGTATVLITPAPQADKVRCEVETTQTPSGGFTTTPTNEFLPGWPKTCPATSCASLVQECQSSGGIANTTPEGTVECRPSTSSGSGSQTGSTQTTSVPISRFQQECSGTGCERLIQECEDNGGNAELHTGGPGPNRVVCVTPQPTTVSPLTSTSSNFGGTTNTGSSKTPPKQEFIPLVGIPGVEDPSQITLAGYINALFVLVIVLGSLFAVVRIGIAGVKYMTSDVVTSKESAKSDILGALLGLAILLSTFIILNTIYPNLVDLNVLKSVEQITVNPPASVCTNPSPANNYCARSGQNVLFEDCDPGSTAGTWDCSAQEQACRGSNGTAQIDTSTEPDRVACVTNVDVSTQAQECKNEGGAYTFDAAYLTCKYPGMSENATDAEIIAAIQDAIGARRVVSISQNWIPAGNQTARSTAIVDCMAGHPERSYIFIENIDASGFKQVKLVCLELDPTSTPDSPTGNQTGTTGQWCYSYAGQERCFDAEGGLTAQQRCSDARFNSQRSLDACLDGPNPSICPSGQPSSCYQK